MWERRVAGMTQSEIAAEFGVSRERVSQVLSRYAEGLVHPKVHEYRTQQAERLDFLWRKLVESGRLAKGDPQSVGAGVRILERYAKLLGLDAPTQIEATVETPDPREFELRELILEAQAQADAEIAVIRGEACPEESFGEER